MEGVPGKDVVDHGVTPSTPPPAVTKQDSMNLEQFLNDTNLQTLQEPLDANGVTMELLLELTEDDIKDVAEELGISALNRVKLVKELSKVTSARVHNRQTVRTVFMGEQERENLEQMDKLLDVYKNRLRFLKQRASNIDDRFGSQSTEIEQKFRELVASIEEQKNIVLNELEDNRRKKLRIIEQQIEFLNGFRKHMQRKKAQVRESIEDPHTTSETRKNMIQTYLDEMFALEQEENAPVLSASLVTMDYEIPSNAFSKCEETISQIHINEEQRLEIEVTGLRSECSQNVLHVTWRFRREGEFSAFNLDNNEIVVECKYQFLSADEKHDEENDEESGSWLHASARRTTMDESSEDVVHSFFVLSLGGRVFDDPNRVVVKLAVNIPRFEISSKFTNVGSCWVSHKIDFSTIQDLHPRIHSCKGHGSQRCSPANLLIDSSKTCYASKYNREFGPGEEDWIVFGFKQHVIPTVFVIWPGCLNKDIPLQCPKHVKIDIRTKEHKWRNIERVAVPTEYIKHTYTLPEDMRNQTRQIRVRFSNNHGECRAGSFRYIVNFIGFQGVCCP